MLSRSVRVDIGALASDMVEAGSLSVNSGCWALEGAVKIVLRPLRALGTDVRYANLEILIYGGPHIVIDRIDSCCATFHCQCG